MNLRAGTLELGASLTLVPRHSGDALEMFDVIDRNRAELHEWLTWVDATRSISDVRRYAQFAQAQFEQAAGFDYSVRVDGGIVGAIGLYQLDWTGRSAQVGYWLVPDARGRGTMTAAVRGLTTHSFDGLLLHRLEIRCVVQNSKSRAVAERLGYELEGILRDAYALHGVYRDIALYAMLAQRWKAGSAGGS